MSPLIYLVQFDQESLRATGDVQFTLYVLENWYNGPVNVFEVFLACIVCSLDSK